jgi:hypothetical protein
VKAVEPELREAMLLAEVAGDPSRAAERFADEVLVPVLGTDLAARADVWIDDGGLVVARVTAPSQEALDRLAGTTGSALGDDVGEIQVHGLRRIRGSA